MIKLVIWDLDDTLWRGTLAERGGVELFEQRAALVRRLNAHGVVSSICSKNDFDTARAKLVELGIWDAFVFPHIALSPKGEAVARIISDMNLRANDVLFVDDNPLNLDEARFHSPGLQVLDIRADDSDGVLEAILTDQAVSGDRLAKYRALEQKKSDRRAVASTSDEKFLRSCEIRACAPAMMANLDFLDRIVELVNRSNQLNYTQSRIDKYSLEHDLVDGYFEYICFSVFAWDKYGSHGLVGFAMVHRHRHYLKHFIFSCRAMHMGLESYVLAKLRELVPETIVPDEWLPRMEWANADWIRDLSYEDIQTKLALFESQGQTVDQTPQMRIAHACQSGGLAHYSEFRKLIDFDIHPKILGLRDFNIGNIDESAIPPFFVYGAGTDYRDEVWPGEADQLDTGLFVQSVHRMCNYLEDRGIVTLVILPPEHLEAGKYREEGLTRSRTISYNAVWEKMAGVYSCLSLLPVAAVCEPDEFVDVNHYRPAALQTISSLMDVWYSHASGREENPISEAA